MNNVNTSDWIQIDMVAVEKAVEKAKAMRDPVLVKVERLTDRERDINPANYGPACMEHLIRLRLTYSNGWQELKEMEVNSLNGRMRALAMRSPAMIGLTRRELTSALGQFDTDYFDEYKRLVNEAKDKAEYERLRTKYGRKSA